MSFGENCLISVMVGDTLEITCLSPICYLEKLMFASGSDDKTVKLWNYAHDNEFVSEKIYEVKSSVTSLIFFVMSETQYLLIGQSDGTLQYISL